MTILLTGGSGFLGSHIAEQLCRNGDNVRALVRSTSDTSFLEKLENIEIIETSLADKDALKKAAKGVDGIIHSAALVKAVNEDEFRRVNVGYTENLLDAAEETRETLKRFVLVSSLAAAGPSATGGIIGNDKIPTPITRYGRSKLAAEQAAQSRTDRLPITVLRPVSLYGPRDKATVIMFKCVKNRVLPYCSSPATRLMLLYGPDFAHACIRAIHADVPSGAAYLVDSGEVYTWKELLTSLEAIIGKKALIRIPPPRFLLGAIAYLADVYSKITNKAFILSRDKMQEICSQFVTDGEEACKALGWTPKMRLKEGLQLTFEWYKNNGWL